MGRPRYPKPDANQGAMANDLRSLGFYVLDCSQLARLGFDLLVCGFHRRWLLPMWCAVEVKDDGGELTEREAEVQAEMQSQFRDDAPVITAFETEDVLDWFYAK